VEPSTANTGGLPKPNGSPGNLGTSETLQSVLAKRQENSESQPPAGNDEEEKVESLQTENDEEEEVEYDDYYVDPGLTREETDNLEQMIKGVVTNARGGDESDGGHNAANDGNNQDEMPSQQLPENNADVDANNTATAPGTRQDDNDGQLEGYQSDKEGLIIYEPRPTRKRKKQTESAAKPDYPIQLRPRSKYSLFHFNFFYLIVLPN